jgi:hypothetical protein
VGNGGRVPSDAPEGHFDMTPKHFNGDTLRAPVVA